MTGALHRLKADGVVLRFKDGWDLAESYPEHIRKSLEKDSKPVRSGKTAKRPASARKNSKGPRAKLSAPPNGRARKPAPERGKSGPTLDERIVTFLRVHPSQRYTARQIANELSETDMRIVGMAFARLVRYDRVNKGDDGLYTATRQSTEHLKAV